jgi:hypothetical protein
MRKLQTWNEFYTYVKESLGEVKTRSGDPFEYKVENDHWLSRRKGTQTWYEITGKNFKPVYQKSINILDTEFPHERKDDSPKREVSADGNTSNSKNTPTSEGPIKQGTESPVVNKQYNIPVSSEDIPSIQGGYKYKERPSDEELVNKFNQIPGLEKGAFETFIDNCQRIGLPYQIALRQIWAESEFNPSAESGDGAKGLCQFMTRTWRSIGGGDPNNPNDSLRNYFKYMDELLKKFPGRIDLAISGYNSGPNKSIYKKALANNIDYNNIPERKLRKETRDYTNYILSA